MSAPLDWRRIEAALIEWAKRQGMTTDRHSRIGDAMAMPRARLNLTLLAQELAKELER